jgi:hypothetical protein
VANVSLLFRLEMHSPAIWIDMLRNCRASFWLVSLNYCKPTTNGRIKEFANSFLLKDLEIVPKFMVGLDRLVGAVPNSVAVSIGSLMVAPVTKEPAGGTRRQWCSRERDCKLVVRTRITFSHPASEFVLSPAGFVAETVK